MKLQKNTQLALYSVLEFAARPAEHVPAGEVDAYVHGGGQYEWDSAAPVAVVTSAGFVARRLDGSPLEYNRPNPWLPDLVVCHPALEAHLREILARAQAREGLDA